MSGSQSFSTPFDFIVDWIEVGAGCAVATAVGLGINGVMLWWERCADRAPTSDEGGGDVEGEQQQTDAWCWKPLMGDAKCWTYLIPMVYQLVIYPPLLVASFLQFNSIGEFTWGRSGQRAP